MRILAWIIGPSHEEVWREFARGTGGQFTAGRDLNATSSPDHKVVTKVNGWKVVAFIGLVDHYKQDDYGLLEIESRVRVAFSPL